MYPVGRPSDFTGGTETYVRELAKGLAKTHLVHVVTPDLELEEQRGPTEWWWPPQGHPTGADVVVAFHNLSYVTQYAADYLVFATNGIDVGLGDKHEFAEAIDAFPVFSQTHMDLMIRHRPTIKPEQCFITGLGVNLDEYNAASLDYAKVPGRLLFANDPARGLWHVLDIFEHLRGHIPESTLHVAYDFERQFEHHKWAANSLAEVLWECKRRLSASDSIVNRGALSRAELVKEQTECQVHVMPSDPPNVGSQIHGITQMECAAAGAALVLDDYEAFPEVFGEAALILPMIGTFLPKSERRFDAQDWAEAIADLMRDPQRLDDMAERSLVLAKHNSWERVVERWEDMLRMLCTTPVTA